MTTTTLLGNGTATAGNTLAVTLTNGSGQTSGLVVVVTGNEVSGGDATGVTYTDSSSNVFNFTRAGTNGAAPTSSGVYSVWYLQASALIAGGLSAGDTVTATVNSSGSRKKLQAFYIDDATGYDSEGSNSTATGTNPSAPGPTLVASTVLLLGVGYITSGASDGFTEDGNYSTLNTVTGTSALRMATRVVTTTGAWAPTLGTSRLYGVRQWAFAVPSAGGSSPVGQQSVALPARPSPPHVGFVAAASAIVLGFSGAPVGSQQDDPPVLAKSPAVAIRSQAEQDSGLALTAALPAPFYQTDWPNPAGKPRGAALHQHHTAALALNLRGQDTFFGGPGAGPDYDWPNPTVRRPAHSWQGQVCAFPLVLRGQDKFPRGAGLGSNYDWPNPHRGAPRGVITNHSWADSFKLTLRGQDAFFGGPGAGPDYDWPNPQRPRPPAHDIGQIALAYSVLVPAPFYQLDWPNPAIPAQPNVLKTWAEPLKQNLLGQDAFFASPGQGPAYDYPNPVRANRLLPEVGRGSPNLLVLAPIVAAPFAQYDWPNPFGPTRTRQDVGSGAFPAIAALTPVQAPFSCSDWPNPVQPRRAGLEASYSVPPWQLLPPFGQDDWPNPQGYRPRAGESTGIGTLRLTPRPVPFVQSHWPNPIIAGRLLPPVGAQASFVITVAPLPPPDPRWIGKTAENDITVGGTTSAMTVSLTGASAALSLVWTGKTSASDPSSQS